MLYLLMKFPEEWNDSPAVHVKFLTIWNGVIEVEKQCFKNCPTGNAWVIFLISD